MLLLFYFILKILFWVKNFHPVSLPKDELTPSPFFISLGEQSSMFLSHGRVEKMHFPSRVKKNVHIFIVVETQGEMKLKAETCIMI